MCIVEAQGRYFWLTREMTEMARSESGVFVTYHALNGAGYVRMTDGSPRNNPFLREMVGVRYIEHMMTGFSTITYIGLW